MRLACLALIALVAALPAAADCCAHGVTHMRPATLPANPHDAPAQPTPDTATRGATDRDAPSDDGGCPCCPGQDDCEDCPRCVAAGSACLAVPGSSLVTNATSPDQPHTGRFVPPGATAALLRPPQPLR